MNETTEYKIRNVKKNVRKAIANYCREKGVTQSRYLEDDKRLKNYL